MNEELIIQSLFLLGIYLLPTIIGYSRAKKNTLAIFVLNFTLGWTIIGWIIALIWACTHEEGRYPLAKGRFSRLLKILFLIFIVIAALKGFVEGIQGSKFHPITILFWILIGLVVYWIYRKSIPQKRPSKIFSRKKS